MLVLLAFRGRLVAPLRPGASGLRALPASTLAPPLEVPLPAGGNRDRPAGDLLGDRGAGRDEGVRGDLEGCHQVGVAADPGARPDPGPVLALPVVVHRDGAGPEARARTDVGVADVAQVVGLHARPELA